MRNSAAVGALAALVVLALAPPAAAGDCVTASSAWKAAIDWPSDPFRVDSGGFEQPGWVKFTLLELPECDPTTVYFQDGNAYEFHYDFAVNELDPFFGLTLEQFNEVTLLNDGREALLGAVVFPPIGFPPVPQIPEYGIQLVGSDPLDAQKVVTTIQRVQAAVNAGPEVQAFYFPTFEQLESAQQNAAFFAANGIQISSPARWSDGNSCYSEGWALGDVKFFPASQIESAFLSGLLEPDDILLTDGIPVDMPLVAGVITLAPAAPNSHTVILANTFQIPFTFLAIAEDAQLANDLIDRKIVLRVYNEDEGFDPDGLCDVRLIDVEDELSAQQVGEILALKTPPPLAIAPIAPFGAYSASTSGLTPAHIDHFGGKASNFGFLRRSIPINSPVSLAVSFDLWTEFLDQTMTSGMTLREEIDAVLSAYPTFPPPDLQAMSSDLAALRDKIEDETAFTAAQQSAILAILQHPHFNFDPFKKLRFRSSTNVEDSEQFTGAGLYDSKSGCLADDLDADTTGPGLCDPSENNEKGVFRAIRKVYASFYLDNAFLERLRHGVDESQVGMAMLVHHSFPDPIELANGVATYTRRPGFAEDALLVSQIDANSVTNPQPGEIPEEVEASIFSPTSAAVTLLAESNLVLLGETVMDWPDDYTELALLLRAAADQFAAETGKTDFVLDFEYKKMAPGGGVMPLGGLVVKQIREIPQPDETPSITPFLVNEPTVFESHSGTPGRVKTRWTVETRSLWLDAPGLAGASLYDELRMEYTDGCRLRELEGKVPDFPGATHGYNAVNWTTTDTWNIADLPNPRTYALTTGPVGLLVSPAESPILTIRDIAQSYPGVRLTVGHRDPVPIWPGSATTTTSEVVALLVRDDDQFRSISFDPAPGVTVDTELFMRPPPLICAGCIPVASSFVQTTITGVTTTPIVLTGFYSQRYSASNHGFTETFDFEPILEPGLSLQTLNELEALDVRVIRVFVDNIFDTVSLDLFDDAAVGQTCVPGGTAGAMDDPSELRLDRAIDTSLALTWGASCLASDDDYAVYEGSLGAFTSHAPVRCTTNGSATAIVTPQEGDRYFLVVPRNASFEGSYGSPSAGGEREQASGPCTAQELESCP